MSLSKKKMFVFLVRSLSSMFLEINVSKLTKLLYFKIHSAIIQVALNRRSNSLFLFQFKTKYSSEYISIFLSNFRSTRNEHKSFKYFFAVHFLS